jgi:hypothetical protein
VTNNPSSSEVPAGNRVQQSVLLFIVMLLGIGVLILAAGNMDPRSFASSQTRYVQWRSNDGYITLERPSDWLPTNEGNSRPFIYSFTTDPNLSNSPALDFVMRAVRYDEPSLQLSADVRSPRAYMDHLSKQGSLGIKAETIRPVSLAGLSGIMTPAKLNAAQGDKTSVEGEIWMLGLDAEHVLLITFVSEAGDWARYRPQFERTIQSLRVDPDFVRILNIPTETTAATPEATAAR